MAFEKWLKLRTEETRVEADKVRNDRAIIYGSYALAGIMVGGAVILGIYNQIELASALFASTAIPATVAASLQNRK